MPDHTVRNKPFHVISADYTVEGIENRLNNAHEQGYRLAGILPNTSSWDPESETSGGSEGALIMYCPESIVYEWDYCTLDPIEMDLMSARGWEVFQVLPGDEEEIARAVFRRPIDKTNVPKKVEPSDPADRVFAQFVALTDEQRLGVASRMIQHGLETMLNSERLVDEP